MKIMEVFKMRESIWMRVSIICNLLKDKNKIF